MSTASSSRRDTIRLLWTSAGLVPRQDDGRDHRNDQLSEGDLVLTFNKTIDLVKQVREMLEDVKPEHGLIGPLRQTENLLCRGIVEQSLSIGFAPIESEPEPTVTAP